MQARRILEIGTLGGFSTIWLARGAGPQGRVVTLEYEPKHAEVARANLHRAGVADRVEVVVGAALDTLPTLTGAPSIWCSSTPTKRTMSRIWSGRSGWPVPAQSLWWTTSFVTARS